MRPDMSWWEAQTLFKEGNSQGASTAEDDPYRVEMSR